MLNCFTALIHPRNTGR